MCEGLAYQVAIEVVAHEERNPERKALLVEELEKLMKDLKLQLDSKGRDIFNTKFNALKGFIYELTPL